MERLYSLMLIVNKVPLTAVQIIFPT